MPPSPGGVSGSGDADGWIGDGLAGSPPGDSGAEFVTPCEPLGLFESFGLFELPGSFDLTGSFEPPESAQDAEPNAIIMARSVGKTDRVAFIAEPFRENWPGRVTPFRVAASTEYPFRGGSGQSEE